MTPIRRAAAAIAALGAALTLAACGVNTIPTQDEQVKAAWAEVQTQYQRRADLVPQLVATVQGIANQEAAVLTAVTEARASATQVQVDASTITDPAEFERFQAAQNQLSGVLGRLMLIQERYPELRSQENFLVLQSQLEGTENRIAIARRDYNDTARQYNTTLRTFPQIIWAKTIYSGQDPAQLFAASAGAEAAPAIEFQPPPVGGSEPEGAEDPSTEPAPGG
jgi:LemA protein